jgi:cell division protein FtsQ
MKKAILLFGDFSSDSSESGMARNDGYQYPLKPVSGSAGPDEFAIAVGEPARAKRPAQPASPTRAAVEDELDSRLLELDVEDGSPFLRAQKRVPVRRTIPKKTAHRIRKATIALIVIAGFAFAAESLSDYGSHSLRFRIDSSDDINIAGNQNVTRGQIMEIFGGDIGRNLFFIPLSQRQQQLEQIPWVESASVMRLLPDHLSVKVTERTPVAFAQVGARILLIDANGVLMEPPAHRSQHYSFPVIVGMGDAEPRSTRAARMRIFSQLVSQLDSDGGHYSQDLSEVDLSDPEDAKITVADDNGAVLVHLGNGDYLEKFKVFKAHVRGWRQQFQKLESVDLRFDRQVIVNPDTTVEAPQPAPPANPPRAAPILVAAHKKKSSAAARRPHMAKLATSKPLPRWRRTR